MPCSWNPSDKGANAALSNNNLTATMTGAGIGAVRATSSVSAGKWYWEVSSTTIPANGVGIGLMKAAASLTSYVGQDTNGWGIFSGDGKVYNNNAQIGTTGSTYVNTDVLMVAFDADNGRLYFGKNGAWMNSAVPASGTGALVTGLTSGPYFPAVSDESANNDTSVITANFGKSDATTYPAPTGFVTIDGTHVLAPVTGAYALTGKVAFRGDSRKTLAGAYALSGKAAVLTKGYHLIAAAGSYALTGVTLIIAEVVAAAGKFRLRLTQPSLHSGQRSFTPNLQA